MTVPLRPQLRPLEVLPAGSQDEVLFVLRDPEGFGKALVVPYGAAVLAMLMDGDHTLEEIQSEFQQQSRAQVPLADLEQIVRRLDEAYLLVGQRFERHYRQQVEGYLANPVRPASHAGQAYPADPDELRYQLGRLFAQDGDPATVDADQCSDKRQLCAVISPHIDLHRGGAVFARAYRQVARHSDAEVFVIFGTAHHPMEEQFCVCRKDFATPLGTVSTDREFIHRLAEHLGSSVAGRQVDPFADELAHRVEHSIEFQAVFLQYVLGRERPLRIVPVLVGSFEEFIGGGTEPDESPELQAFLAAVRAAAEGLPRRICYISGADLAHVGQQFGDQWKLDRQRLHEQAEDDRKLLEAVCRCDPAGLFAHVAGQQDRRRICGLPPTYVMLQVIRPAHGELLKYDQAVDPQQTSCVSFAAVAYYR